MGGQECAPVKEARAEMRRQASEHHVMHLGQKRLREDGGKAVAISFSDEDLEGITTPHNDALVITLNVNTFETEGILVDQGSSTDILYYKAFKKMGLTEADLKEVTSDWFQRGASLATGVGDPTSQSGEGNKRRGVLGNRCTIGLQRHNGQNMDA